MVSSEVMAESDNLLNKFCAKKEDNYLCLMQNFRLNLSISFKCAIRDRYVSYLGVLFGQALDFTLQVFSNLECTISSVLIIFVLPIALFRN